MPTCHKGFAVLERLQSRWEGLLEDDNYSPVHEALMVGLKNMQKWYRKTDEMSIYFVSHGMILALFFIDIPHS